jgi:hypothetical protein
MSNFDYRGYKVAKLSDEYVARKKGSDHVVTDKHPVGILRRVDEYIDSEASAPKLDAYTATGIAEGWIECDSEDDYLAAWKYLHDTGLAYTLQGWFGRTATRLIEDGLIAA